MRQYMFAVIALALASCAGGPQSPRGFEPKLANPSAVIAAEIAFNRLAQEKGQWTSFRETAAKDAVMFVPQPVNAQLWLKGRADPPVSVKWQPHKAFMSCDGKTGVTTGAWQRPNGAVGYFTTIWQWLEKGNQGDGEWKWVLDHGDALAAPRDQAEMIETRVASCKGKAPAALVAPPEGAIMKMGLSRDQSLNWTWIAQPSGARTLEVRLWNGEATDSVILDKVAAEK
ncbi:MAG: hypothetical protein ABI668_00620 [Sphingorhabdus sp.]